MSPEPVSLSAEIVGGQVAPPGQDPVPVVAWVTYDDGNHREVRGHAVAWTTKAVRVEWEDESYRRREAWLWAQAVTELVPWGGEPSAPR